jgi:pimeloyl-ACP methyl ester carboxylesterase
MSKKTTRQMIVIFAIVIPIFVSSSTVVLSPSSPSHNDNNNSMEVAYAQQSDGSSTNNNNNVQTVNFLTDDGVSIIGSYYTPLNVVSNASSSTTTPTVILLHMLGKDRGTWNAFASTLSQKGSYAVLSIDLRGHGESVKQNNGNTISFQSFTPDDYNKMVLDAHFAYTLTG